MSPYIVIVTGRCPKCAATLFEDEAAAHPQQGAGGDRRDALTRAELLAAERGVRRAEARGDNRVGPRGSDSLGAGERSAVLVKDVVACALAKSGHLLCSLFFSLRES